VLESPSKDNPLLNDERTRSVVDDRKGIWHEETCATYLQKFFSGKSGGRKLQRNQLVQIHLKVAVRKGGCGGD